ncbi:hypothetical protein U6A24_07400 [Aquimarina gracilis]|uniref:Natural product n=1 Tax=Aquimarina gracilis TaxID=874422 RepID=A0ABU5ZTI1_9FLAO|nr:hypothetical protein [Aquimarina gracilis]MEB3345278.1 hypothetical protein [Aquimarina gracilis]
MNTNQGEKKLILEKITIAKLESLASIKGGAPVQLTVPAVTITCSEEGECGTAIKWPVSTVTEPIGA